MKIKKSKFIRNIIIGVIALIIVAFIINVAPGYKRNRYKDVINLVIGDTNVTEKLKKPIYKDENNVIYISKEDVKNLLDETLYYDTNEKMILATSVYSVASMKLNEKYIEINGATLDTLYETIEYNDTIYIPIEEFNIVYNIETDYIEKSNTVIIDKLNDGMIKAEVEEKTKIKFKPRKLSKKVETIEPGEIVSAFYTTSKGWRLIRTTDGTVGYVKANALTNEYILRQDMVEKKTAEQLNTKVTDNTELEIDNEKIIIKDMLKLAYDETIKKNENYKIWTNLDINNLELNSYEERSKIVKTVISFAIKNNVKGINVIINENSENVNRFVIELAPRLRELGIKTNIVINEKVDKEIFKNVVNYVIEKN